MAGGFFNDPNRECVGEMPIWTGAPDDGPEATGATAGTPGTWTPSGAQPPDNPSELAQGIPNVVVASPSTPWTSGQYVQTMTSGAAGRATWTGTSWVSGAAPLEFDPADHTVDEVKAYVTEHMAERDRILAAERAGKNRTTLIEWLESC